MKRTIAFAMIVLCLSAFAVSCNSTIRTTGTSLVRITVGTKKAIAKLDVMPATAWAKMTLFLSRAFETPDAVAAIPLNVQTVRLTVSAGGMSTITETANTAGQSEVTFVIEVPNGSHRKFVLEAIDGVNNWAFWGRAFADLDGTAITLPVNMINLGSVSRLDFVSTSGDDNTGDGSESKPFRTITKAIATTGSNQGILVEAGTYDTAGGEVYPLQLNPGSALACLGPNHSTVLDDTGNSTADGTTAMIYGEQDVFIDGCMILATSQMPGTNWLSAIDDGGLTVNVNNTYVDGGGSTAGCPYTDGIVLSASSSVRNTTITGFPGCEGGGNGINIAADAIVSGNSISANNDGIYISSGNPVISNNVITGNHEGIYTSSTGSPSLSNNSITANNGNAISSYAGNPSITGNTITGMGSSSGLYISDGAPTIAGNTITNTYYGIETGGGLSLNPTITNNTLSGNYYGMYLYQSAGTISGNTIRNNTLYGIYAQLVGATSIHGNSLSCNTSADLYLVDSTANDFDLTNNAWDHDASTVVTGPTITSDLSGCPAGEDICYTSVLTAPPVSSPSATAVAGGCL